MVMGDRIKPSAAAQAAGDVKKIVGTAAGDPSPEADAGTGRNTADIKRAGDTAGAAGRP